MNRFVIRFFRAADYSRNLRKSHIDATAPAMEHDDTLALQRMVGNQLLLHSSYPLPLSEPGDHHEREAEALSQQLLSENTETPVARTVVADPQHNTPPLSAASTPEIQRALQSEGKPLPAEHSAAFSQKLGVDLSQIKIHDGAHAENAARSVGARAFSLGNHIVFGRGEYQPQHASGRELIAHEVAHTALPQHRGIMRAVAKDYPLIRSSLSWNLNPLAGPLHFVTSADAKVVLGILAKLNAQDTADTLAQMRADGLVDILIASISNADLIAFLQGVQRKGALQRAAALGFTNQAAMAKAQGSFMHKQNQAAAVAAHGPSATPAQVAAQQSSQAASTSIAPQTATLSPSDEILFNGLATMAMVNFIVWVSTAHPKLGIKASHIKVDSRAVFDRGANIIAFGSGGQAVVGKSFADAVAADPAYALPTVVHELFGHPQYGAYGTPGAEYNLEIYDQAAATMPGYVQPTGAGRTSEIDAYAYQETEIYSLMREVPFFKPVTAAHSALASVNFDPVPEIANRIGIIKQQFEIRVAQSLLRGMWMRYRLDPRLEPAALAAFAAGVKAHFTAAQAKLILQ